MFGELTADSSRFQGLCDSIVECYSKHIMTRIRIPTAGVAFGQHRSVLEVLMGER